MSKVREDKYSIDERLDKLLKSFEESSAKDKRAAEREKRTAEYEKEREKSNAEWEKWKKEMQKYVGVSDSNGAMAEEMIYNSLEQDMIFAGIEFDAICHNMKIKSKSKKLEGEYDIVLTNDDTLAIVETKYNVRLEDVTKLVDENVAKFRVLFPEFNDYKILLGIGGMSFEKRAITEAKNNGIGIIKIVGDKVEYHTENIKVY